MYTCTWKIWTLLMLMCLIFETPTVGATTLLYQNFDDLVSKAEAIVIGTVQKTAPHKGSEKKSHTFVTLTDLQVILGDYHQKTLVLRIQGGEIEGKGMIVVGSPIFKPDDRVLLFLRGNGKNMVPVVGWTQGVFRIIFDSVNQQDVVTDYQGNRLFGINANNLIKEHVKRNGEANILGGDSLSNSATINPGVNEDGSIPTVTDHALAELGSTPMSKKEFIEIIKQWTAQKQKPSIPVESAEIPDLITEQTSSKVPVVPSNSAASPGQFQAVDHVLSKPSDSAHEMMPVAK